MACCANCNLIPARTLQILRASIKLLSESAMQPGTSLAVFVAVTGRRVEDVRVWQVAHAFTHAVCRLLKASAVAAADMRFSVSLFRAARAAEAAVAEGIRNGADQASSHALGEAGHQIAAALVAIEDGIDRGYFSKSASQTALGLGREAARIARSLETYLERRERASRGGRRRLARDAL